LLTKKARTSHYSPGSSKTS